MTTMPAEPRYRIAANVAWVDSVESQRAAEYSVDVPEGQQPEAWLARVPDGEPLSLNGSGLEIWLACAELAEGRGSGTDGDSEIARDGITLTAIVRQVRESLGTDEVPQEDVAVFLDELTRRGLIECRLHEDDRV